jgi:hypothetical protein
LREQEKTNPSFRRLQGKATSEQPTERTSVREGGAQLGNAAMEDGGTTVSRGGG